MKKLIRKILTGEEQISEYATISVIDYIKERIYLDVNNNLSDVSQNQWVLCLEPLVFGVWVEDEKIKAELVKLKKCKLTFIDSNAYKKKVATAELELIDKIEEETGALLLLQLKNSKLHHLNFFKIHFLFHRYYKKPNFPFKKFKSLVTAYSYPRKVRITSFKSDNHYNIFPMDLIGEIEASKRMALGLKNTNKTLPAILETKKITVSEVSFSYKETIYKLGSHHSKTPPLITELPFKVSQSKIFGFYIPEWAESYKEIQILKTVNLGSHMLMWGEIINEVILNPKTRSLYHIHFLHWLHQKGRDIEYNIL